MRTRRFVLPVLLLLAAVTLSAEQRVYSVKDAGITAPVLLETSRPNYTQEAWEKRIAGVVTLDCDVQVDGTVGAVLVTQSLDSTLGLDEQAIQSVRQWKFRAGTRNGQPVPIRVSVSVRFSLDRKPQ